MSMGHIWIAVLTLSALALAVSRVTPADAASLQGYWELHVHDINAPTGCSVEEDRVVIVTEQDGRAQGRVGMYFYRDIEQIGDTLKAQYPGKWDDVLGSKAVESELNARKLSIRFEGRVSEDGNKIVTRETVPCANHSGDQLNHVHEYQTTGTLKRVDLAIAFIQQQKGRWRAASTIDFGRPFQVEVRVARDLWLESYPITLAWLDGANAGDKGGYKSVTAEVHRVSGESRLYRSAAFRLERPAESAAPTQPQDTAGGQVLDPSPGAVLYAVVGNQPLLDFAAEARAGAPKQIPLGVVLAVALLLAAWLAIRLLTERAPLPSRAFLRIPDFGTQVSRGETTNLQSAAACSATGRRDNGRQPAPPANSSGTPTFQVRAKRGQSYTTVRLKGAAG